MISQGVKVDAGDDQRRQGIFKVAETLNDSRLVKKRRMTELTVSGCATYCRYRSARYTGSHRRLDIRLKQSADALRIAIGRKRHPHAVARV